MADASGGEQQRVHTHHSAGGGRGCFCLAKGRPAAAATALDGHAAFPADARRTELERLRLSELQRCALDGGLPKGDVEAALDGDAPKTMLVELVLSHEGRSVGGKRESLEAELAGLKLKALKQRARASGVGQDALDDADDADDVKSAVIQLIVEASDISTDAMRVDARQALEAELAGLKLKALKQRARASGVGQDALDDADDAVNVRAAVIDLIAAARSEDAANIGFNKSLSCTDAVEDKPHFGSARPAAAAAGLDGPHAVAARATTSASLLAASTKHVMLSYQWSHQAQVKRVHNLLTKLGVKCWMDITGGMGADIYDSMAQGMFVCPTYFAVVWCVCRELFLTHVLCAPRRVERIRRDMLHEPEVPRE